MGKKLLIIGFVWPEPKSSAAGVRMMQLIHFFIEESFSITFVSASALSDKAFNLSSIGVVEKKIKLNDSSFDDFIKQLNPNVVLFDRFMTEEQFGWRVQENCPNAIRILDTEDLHFLRKGRHQAIKDNLPFDKKYLFNDTAKREIASIYRCDLSLIISEAEMDILKNQFKIEANLLLYLPFILDELTIGSIKSLPKFEEREHFTTIGNFLHEPNLDAVIYLKNDIWPLIRKQLPEVELLVYGAYSSRKVEQLNSKEDGFLIKGFAADVNEVMRKARVCLAPLRFGAGLKGKLIDALKNGTPCVTTTIGAEGIINEPKFNRSIADDPKTFASEAADLYNNSQRWYEMQQYGFDVVNTKFQKCLYQDQVINSVKNISDNLTQHRLSNFIGEILRYHTLNSTKYMSKWIEEKNK